MKKRSLFVVVVLVLIAALALIVTACDSTTYFKITLDYEASQGTVSLTPPSENGGGYSQGTKVTVSVEAKEGFEIATFAVSGQPDATLDEEGKYTFAIQADTKVTVTFKRFYTVTLDYEASQGTVTLEPASEDGKYAEGTQITVSVEAKEGYKLATFAVSGQPDAALDEEGKYTFEIKADTTVAATFEMLTFEEAFASLQGSVFFDGKMINHDYGFDEEVTVDNTALFDAAANAIWQTIKDEDGYYFNAIYANVGGKVALVTHDEDGKLDLIKSTDNFAEYFNPFALLTPADFTEVEEGVWELAANKADAAATAITGYVEDIASFRIWFENGVFTKLQIMTERVVNEEQGLDNEYEYLYDIKEIGTAQVPAEWLADYTMTAEHEALKKALEEAATASSYTISEHKVEIGYESEDLDTNIYVTQNAIYEDLEDWESGYVEFDDVVFSFSYDPETQTTTFDDEPYYYSLDYFKALFTFDEFSYSLMGYDGNGQYSVRIPELFIQKNYGDLAGAVASLFAVGVDRIQYYSGALDCTITLKEGKLHQVCFTYEVYGFSEQVTLTFSDFGTTTLPIKIEGEPEIPETSIPKEYIGTFKGTNKDDGTAYEITVTADDITVKIGENSYPATIRAYSDYYGFTLTVNDKVYYMAFGDEENEQLVFYDDDTLMVYLLREGSTEQPEPSEPEIPTKYIGVYKGEDEAGTAYEITITAEDITVKFGTQSYTATIEEYDDLEGFTLTVNGETYYLVQYGYDETFDRIEFVSEDSHTVNVELTRESGETEQPTIKIPEKFIGTFKGEDEGGTAYEIDITAKDITVKIGTQSYTATIEEYDDSEGYFDLTVNGTSYILMDMTYDEPISKIFFALPDYSSSVILTREGAEA